MNLKPYTSWAFLAPVLGTLILGVSCRKRDDATRTPVHPAAMPATVAVTPPAAPQHTGVVQEVLQATSYTYLRVREGDQDTWMAISKQDLQVGDSIGFDGGLEMRDFASKDLNRTFERILFVDRIRTDLDAAVPAATPAGSPHALTTPPGTPQLGRETVTVAPLTGGTTIGQVYTDPNAYAGKTIRVRGQVVKVNRGILGHNWIHLQDGTEGQGHFDLAVTTQDDAEVGDVVVFEGAISLNVDFTAGYRYDVIMQEAKRRDE